LASHVIAPAARFIRRPGFLSTVDAAGSVLASATAWYALHDAVRLERGERVFIHGADTAVGQAAVRIALSAGAEVHAAAASSRLESLKGLGLASVVASDSPGFVDALLRAPLARGAEVVCNTLPGAAGSVSALLARGGRFLELAPSDLAAGPGLGGLEQGASRRRFSYHAIDLAELAEDRPAAYRSALERVLAMHEAGALAFVPTRSYPLGDATKALAADGTEGERVLVFEEGRTASLAIPIPSWTGISPEGAYLLGGDGSAVNAALVRWLVSEGASHLVVVTPPPAPHDGEAPTELAQTIQAAEASGVRVEWKQATAFDRESWARLLRVGVPEAPRWRGVFYGVRASERPLGLDWMEKVVPALELATATEGLSLEGFALVSVLGAAPGGNEEAIASAFAALAATSARGGLPSLALTFAPAAVGEARPDELKRLLGEALATRQSQLVAMPARVDGAWFERVRAQPRFTEPSAELSTSVALASTRAALLALSDPKARRARLDELLRTQLAAVLGMDAARLHGQTQLHGLGLDSLMALELRKRIEQALGVRLSAALLLAGGAITALVDHLVELWEQSGGTPSGPSGDDTRNVEMDSHARGR
ncbi:MAG: phosphopantetheine-binding protein, partial [Cystobacter sp.]